MTHSITGTAADNKTLKRDVSKSQYVGTLQLNCAIMAQSLIPGVSHNPQKCLTSTLAGLSIFTASSKTLGSRAANTSNRSELLKKMLFFQWRNFQAMTRTGWRRKKEVPGNSHRSTQYLSQMIHLSTYAAGKLGRFSCLQLLAQPNYTKPRAQFDGNLPRRWWNQAFPVKNCPFKQEDFPSSAESYFSQKK